MRLLNARSEMGYDLARLMDTPDVNFGDEIPLVDSVVFGLVDADISPPGLASHRLGFYELYVIQVTNVFVT